MARKKREYGTAKREKLLAAIQAQPGTSFRGLLRVTGMAAGTARHHFTTLRKQKLIWEACAEGRSMFFPGERPLLAEATPLIAKALAPTHTGAIEAAIGDGVVNQKHVLAAVDAPQSTVQHNLERLVELGRVTMTRQGRQNRYQLAKWGGTVEHDWGTHFGVRNALRVEVRA